MNPPVPIQIVEDLTLEGKRPVEWLVLTILLLCFSWKPSYAVDSADCTEPSENRIDEIVEQQLRRDGEYGTPPAGRHTLIRRLSFDLIGLPPTSEEVRIFLSDESPDAYTKVVDRLLASPRFGERMAQFWLDLARYADSGGYHDDTIRSMWLYRDYVINAFNENKPFDKFTIEQLAGDLLPSPTAEQLVATGFHRNAPTTSEDGANPDEYRARYAADRVNTTSQVWLGLTVQCAECHDHKYDAISTKEYYQLFAFFNQSPEEPLHRGLHAPPTIAVPDEKQKEQLRRLDQRIASANQQFKAASQKADGQFGEWVETITDLRPFRNLREAVACEFLFDDPENVSANTGTRRRPARYVSESKKDGERFPSQPKSFSGPFGNAIRLRGKDHLDLGPLFEVRAGLPFTMEAWLQISADGGGPLFSRVDTEDGSRGFEVRIVDGRIVVRLVENWPDKAIQLSTVGRIPVDQWTHLSVTFDGRLEPDSFFLYINGVAQDLGVDIRGPVKRVRNRSPFLIGAGSEANFEGNLDEIRLYKWALNQELEQLPLPGLQSIVPHVERRSSNSSLLKNFFLNSVYLPTKSAKATSDLLSRQKQLLMQEIPRVRVMRDIEVPRETHILVRGDFRSLGDKVLPHTPSLLPPMVAKPPDSLYNRLDLARWLVVENREQTATVFANRVWALLFGRGVVPTLDDFGVNGAEATHPELVQWLRDELLHRNWDVKSLIREIVLSRTYRQSSRATAGAWEEDPNNASLARGPRHRLTAEMIRDNALAISGLLSNRIGGPSIRPYQPAGLWREMSLGDDASKAYETSEGESLYRRGIYVFWKRSIHYPTFAIFDAPSREVCTSSRPTTNSPTQALVLLNDPAFVEAAKGFAKLIVTNEDEFNGRLQFAFLRALSRRPLDAEVATLRSTYRNILADYTRNPELARDLMDVGEFCKSVDSSDCSDVELAAWTSLAQMILTLDETITKE